MALADVALRKVRAAEYRERASLALAEAEACGLDHVKRKLELSAAAWTELAEAAERSRRGSEAAPAEAAPADSTS